MKLIKDNVIRTFDNDYDIAMFKDNGWVEVKETPKKENVEVKTTKTKAKSK